jgi:hypothetical protein
MSKTIDVAALLDRSSWSAYQKLLTALAALAVIFDGVDIQILGFAIPSLITGPQFVIGVRSSGPTQDSA